MRRSTVPICSAPSRRRLFSRYLAVIVVSLGAIGPMVVCRGEVATPSEGAALINRHFEEHWAARHIEPASPADDATFLRRATLDLIGRTPTLGETRQFLGSSNADKRRDLIERLLRQPAHARHFASVWRRIWLPQTQAPPHDYLADEFEHWLALEFQSRTSYDEIVRRLLSAASPPQSAVSSHRPGAPKTFLLANEMRPEELAANASRELLGVNLECAQCHDHPFASWKRQQFWQAAAFFVNSDVSAEAPEIPIPDSSETASAQVWTGDQLDWVSSDEASSPRRVFAEWTTSSTNPYFARNAVNRLWHHLLGAPLCEPIDDLSSADQSPHAELLDKLATALAAHDFDLRFVTQAIMESRTYQLNGPRTEESRSQSDFDVAAVRSMSGEQLYDSLELATGRPALQLDLDSPERLLQRRQFVDAFQANSLERPKRSVVQSLALMNGVAVAELTDSEQCPTVAVVAEGPFTSDSQRVEFLYKTILSRDPSPEESDSLVKLLEDARRRDALKPALADIVWAMLNSVEFNTNH